MPQPPRDYATGDAESKLSEGVTDPPDERADVDADASSFGSRAAGGGSGDGDGVGKSADGGDGVRVLRETSKAGARGQKAGYSEEVLAERMAHLLSQRYTQAS